MTISISYRLITLYGFTEGIINENENEKVEFEVEVRRYFKHTPLTLFIS
jgi:hypothetical protein